MADARLPFGARSLEDVRSNERSAYIRLLAAIDGASDEELFDGGHFAWTEGDPLADWFRGNTDEHYDEHLEQLTRLARAAPGGAKAGRA